MTEMRPSRRESPGRSSEIQARRLHTLALMAGARRAPARMTWLPAGQRLERPGTAVSSAEEA